MVCANYACMDLSVIVAGMLKKLNPISGSSAEGAVGSGRLALGKIMCFFY